MKKSKQIGILGCGWLGKAAAKVLIKKGHFVKGSTTTVKGSKALKDLEIEPYVIKLVPGDRIDNLQAFLSDLQVLIIAVPPKFSHDETHLLDSLKMMFDNYKFSALEQLIYISSTGVFKDEESAVYDEDSKPNNNSRRGEYLIALENIILNQNKINSGKVLRYGGLLKHGGRHPIHYLSGKKDIQNPNAPVNLIEQADAVNLLCRIVEGPSQSKIFHGVHPSHPNRKTYYENKAKELNLKPPEFVDAKVSLGKIILTEKTQTELNFKFKSGI